MKVDFRNIDFEALASAWNKFHSPKYAVDSDQLKLNTVESPVFDWGASAAEVDASGEVKAFVIIKRSAATLYKGPDQDTAHLSSVGFCDPNIAVDLFGTAREMLRDRGISRIVFGADSRHFFPGAPTDMPGISNYLTIEGFVAGGEAEDLERDLRDYTNPFPVSDAYDFRPSTKKDLGAIDEFLLREFPGCWRYDVNWKLGVEDNPAIVFGMFNGKRCEGFALLQDWKCKCAIGGGVWRQDLGENWGSLGPIGVAKDLRGKGLGNALLGRALDHQRYVGVHRCIIDWTGLIRYYGGHGFKVNRTYRSMTLRLD